MRLQIINNLNIKVMKKLMILTLLLGVLMSMSSCAVKRMTSSEKDIEKAMISIAFADLDVDNYKISYTYVPSKDVRRGGLSNCINVAIREALKKKGDDADILVETQEATVIRYGIFKNKIKSVTVTGYPARYKNFRSASEDTYNEVMKQSVIKVPENCQVFSFFKK